MESLLATIDEDNVIHIWDWYVFSNGSKIPISETALCGSTNIDHPSPSCPWNVKFEDGRCSGCGILVCSYCLFIHQTNPPKRILPSW